MKTTSTLLLITAIFFTGCEENDFKKELTDGFCIVSNDEVISNHHDIEYYDYSSHLIYLKNSKSFANNIKSIAGFKVFAGKEEIYSGQTVPGYSSFLPSGPVINTHPSFYGDYIIPLSHIQIIDALGNLLPDPREDERIIKALKKYNQFHGGLSCEIKSIQYFDSNNVKVQLLLKNNDPFPYYYLDPDKIGIGLFHYFTNGLSIRDNHHQRTYTHKIETVHAEPWNAWEKDWLSIINGNESKTIMFTYDNFEEVVPGQYKATFTYPGLGFQVEKQDVLQDNGQIWLGQINMIKDVAIE